MEEEKEGGKWREDFLQQEEDEGEEEEEMIERCVADKGRGRQKGWHWENEEINEGKEGWQKEGKVRANVREDEWGHR